VCARVVGGYRPAVRIVWNSFHGRYGDNPRALFERLRDRVGTEHVWLAQHAHLAGFPADVTTVDVDGPEATEALEAADLVVANTHTEVEWRKREGATYLQTWHGTPLKRVHRDVLWAPPGRLDYLDRDVALWDWLVSPNAVATTLLRQAFRWDGPVWETGYPRNDVLASAAHDERRAEVRDRLALEPDRTVVLFAPTWRDDEGYDTSRSVPLRLDLELVGRALGDDHTVLLRAHNLVSGRWEATEQPWSRDVSTVPSDIADLYTAADVLVTDYSSAMFDFSVTGRPIVFLAADLEQYAGQTRGLYFDLWPDAPGPLVRSTAELVEVLRDLPSVREQYAAPYAAFRERYNSLEDGHATERVLDRLGLG